MTAEQIALVHDRPELTAVGLPGKAVRIGGRRRNARLSRGWIDLKYAARSVSLAMPFSPALLLDPTVT